MKKKISFAITILTFTLFLLLFIACDSGVGGDSGNTPSNAECTHSYTKTAIKEATCTEDGTLSYICSLCNSSYTESVKALGHAEINVEAKAPECTSVGWNAYVGCSRCDEYKLNYVEIPELGHDEQIVPAKVPTCTEDGYESYGICARCNTTTEKVIIGAIEHSFKNYNSLDEDKTSCRYQYKREAYCEYGCGEKSVTIYERGPHDPAWDYTITEKTSTTGYMEFVIFCDDCECELDKFTVSYNHSAGAPSYSGSKGKWMSDPMLKLVPYPDGFTVDHIDLNSTAVSGYYGYAGGIFTTSNTAKIQAYIESL